MAAIDFLKRRSIPFPEGATASYVPATSQLVVCNTDANMQRVIDLLNDENGVPQANVSTRWIVIDLPVSPSAQESSEITTILSEKADGTKLADPRYQTILHELAQMRQGVSLTTAPIVTARLGQCATVETVREFPRKQSADDAAKGLPPPKPDFIGPSNSFLVHRYNGQLVLYVHGDLGELDSSDPADPRVKHLRKSKTAVIRDGETLLVSLGEAPTSPKRLVLLFVTVNLMDPGTTAAPETPNLAAPAGNYYARKMEKIIFPTLNLKGATIAEAIEFLRIKSRDYDTAEPDPTKRGVNLVIKPGATLSSPPIDVDLRNVTMSDALRCVAELAHVTYDIQRYAVVVTSLPEFAEVSFVTGAKRFAHGDDIVIEKVTCSSPNFNVGDRVVVQGRYLLSSVPDAGLSFGLTRTMEPGMKITATPREERLEVKRGSGVFSLAQIIQYEGVLHLDFYKGSNLGGLYFGTQEQVDHITQLSSRRGTN
jgi:hypothetical protein